MSTSVQRQSGFAHVIAVVVMVGLVVAIGASVWFAMNRAQNQKASETTTKPSTSQASPTSADTKTAQQAEPAPTPAPALAPACTADSTLYVTPSIGLRLHTERSNESPTVVVMPYRASVKAGCLENGWYKVAYNNSTGYALATYLSATQPAAPTANITHPTQANCNNQSFTVYASVSSGTKQYYSTDTNSKVVSTTPYGQTMTGSCGSFIAAGWIRVGNNNVRFEDVSTTKP